MSGSGLSGLLGQKKRAPKFAGHVGMTEFSVHEADVQEEARAAAFQKFTAEKRAELNELLSRLEAVKGKLGIEKDADLVLAVNEARSRTMEKLVKFCNVLAEMKGHVAEYVASGGTRKEFESMEETVKVLIPVCDIAQKIPKKSVEQTEQDGKAYSGAELAWASKLVEMEGGKAELLARLEEARKVVIDEGSAAQ